MKLALLICMLLSSFQSYANWEYDESSKSIYTIYKTEDAAGWNVHVILTVTGNKVFFSATVPFDEYKQIFTLNPPHVLNYRGIKLVKHNTFFGAIKAIKSKLKLMAKYSKIFTRALKMNIRYLAMMARTLN